MRFRVEKVSEESDVHSVLNAFLRLQDAESALRDEKESTEVLLHSSFNDSPIISPFANALLAQILW